MLRLPRYRYHRPTALEEAQDAYLIHGPKAMFISGGTDLIPNLKHRLFEPEHLISLRGVASLKGISRLGDVLRIGATETLTATAAHPLVRRLFPALSEAAGAVAGPQLRNSGTIGGNVCLETRCTYYNQTEFWRNALGYCLKKDGDACHVTRVGRKCVAAHSADTPPVLACLDASVEIADRSGTRVVPVTEFFVADGIANTVRGPHDLVVSVHIPLRSASLRQGYAKLRQRRSIDFPLLTVAVSAEMTEDGADGGRVKKVTGVVTAIGSRPRLLTGWNRIARGNGLTDEVIDALAERAHRQCHPLTNIAVDVDWRRAMVPVFTRRALEAAKGRPPRSA